MSIDANTVDQNKNINTDVCILGAGTAGITLAREFIGLPFRIAVLESGGLKPDKETQLLNWGKNVGHPYYSLDTARPRYLGGSTNRWHLCADGDCHVARMRPLEEIDFKERDWVPNSGWPFGKEALDPYYDRAQEVCGITPASYNVNDWSNSEKSPCLAFTDNSVETIIFKFGSRHPFLKDYIEQFDRADNIDLFINANVTDIEADRVGKTITRVRVANLEGNKFWVRAKLFILSAGAIENARLLLVSRSVMKNGLGNQNDLVGRYFMEHPHCSSGVFVPSPKTMNMPMNLYRSVQSVNDVPVIGKLSLSEGTVRRERLLSNVIELYPKVVLEASLAKYPVINSPGVQALRDLSKRKGASYGENLKTIMTGLDDVAKTVYRRAKSRLFEGIKRKRVLVYQMQSMSEQIPDPDSRVLLAEEKDALGMPRVKLDWRLNEIDIRSITKTHEIMDKAFRESGLGRVLLQLYEELPSPSIYGGWHHMGTTRMSQDPRKGVVDENSKVHGLSNLFIAGPSVFPTGGYANPSLTIVALSIRLADHIEKTMKER